MSPRQETDIGSATLVRALGALLLALGIVTAFEARYLLVGTVPLLATGVLCFVLPHTAPFQRVMAASMWALAQSNVSEMYQRLTRAFRSERQGGEGREETAQEQETWAAQEAGEEAEGEAGPGVSSYTVGKS